MADEEANGVCVCVCVCVVKLDYRILHVNSPHSSDWL